MEFKRMYRNVIKEALITLRRFRGTLPAGPP